MLETLASILQTIDNLLPAKFILHSGACDEDVLSAYCDLRADKVHVISEDLKQYDRFISRQVVPHTFKLLPGLITARGGECAYYRASIERESGLLGLSELHPLWPNISIREELMISTTGLEQIQNAVAPAPNWLILNQLGAADIIDQALFNDLNLDVLVIRCVDDKFDQDELASSRAGKIDAIMFKFGYKLFASLAERHPKSCKRFYLKDWKSTLNMQLLDLQLEAETLRQAKNAISAELKLVNQQHTIARADLDSLQSENARQQEKNESLSNQLGIVQREAEQTTAQLEELNNLVRAQTESHAEEIRNLNEALEARTSEVSLAKEQFSSVSSEQEALVTDIKLLTQRVENLARENGNLSDILQQVQSERDEVLQLAKSTEEKLDTELGLAKQSAIERSELESRAEAAEKKLALAKNDLRDLRREFKSLTVRAEKMQDVLTQTRGHLVSLRTSLPAPPKPRRTKPKAAPATETNGS